MPHMAYRKKGDVTIDPADKWDCIMNNFMFINLKNEIQQFFKKWQLTEMGMWRHSSVNLRESEPIT